MKLDNGFFKVRFDRLTLRQQEYAIAMAKVEKLPAKSGDIAKTLNISVKKAAPIRAELIKKEIAYRSEFGKTTFSVPKFDKYLRRAEKFSSV